MRFAAALALPVVPAAVIGSPATAAYDVVILHARAIDPETGLDAIRNIGITGEAIIAVSPLSRSRGNGPSMAAASLPLPALSICTLTPTEYEKTSTYQAVDGVTTRLELEIGVYPVKPGTTRKPVTN